MRNVKCGLKVIQDLEWLGVNIIHSIKMMNNFEMLANTLASIFSYKSARTGRVDAV